MGRFYDKALIGKNGTNTVEFTRTIESILMKSNQFKYCLDDYARVQKTGLVEYVKELTREENIKWTKKENCFQGTFGEEDFICESFGPSTTRLRMLIGDRFQIIHKDSDFYNELITRTLKLPEGFNYGLAILSQCIRNMVDMDEVFNALSEEGKEIHNFNADTIRLDMLPIIERVVECEENDLYVEDSVLANQLFTWLKVLPVNVWYVTGMAENGSTSLDICLRTKVSERITVVFSAILKTNSNYAFLVDDIGIRLDEGDNRLTETLKVKLDNNTYATIIEKLLSRNKSYRGLLDIIARITKAGADQYLLKLMKEEGIEWKDTGDGIYQSEFADEIYIYQSQYTKDIATPDVLCFENTQSNSLW